MAEQEMQQPVQSLRDKTLERIRSKHADKQFADDEAYYGQIGEDYDDYEKQLAERDQQLSGYKEREGAFSKLFTSDPRSAAYLQKWRDGGDPAIALIEEFGDDIKDIIDDPERLEEVAAANKKYAERVAKEKASEEEYKKNLKESVDYLDKLEAEGKDSDTIDKAMELLIGIVTDGIMGKFSPESIKMAMKALHYDGDVANASEEGVIKGRNEKIDEKLKKIHSGDGHGPLGGESGVPAEGKKRNFGPLDNFGAGDDIWKRGGEKRIKY